jgi:hypothetical protein
MKLTPARHSIVAMSGDEDDLAHRAAILQVGVGITSALKGIAGNQRREHAMSGRPDRAGLKVVHGAGASQYLGADRPADGAGALDDVVGGDPGGGAG